MRIIVTQLVTKTVQFHVYDILSCFRCECASGYRGINCNQKFDPCLSHKCENGGVCEINKQSSIGYQCNCIGEFRYEYYQTIMHKTTLRILW